MISHFEMIFNEYKFWCGENEEGGGNDLFQGIILVNIDGFQN
jgi:hypothetical protein